MTLRFLSQVLFLLFTTTAVTSSATSFDKDEAVVTSVSQHLRRSTAERSNNIERRTGIFVNVSPSESGEEEEEEGGANGDGEDDEKLNEGTQIDFDDTPWWEEPACDVDELQVLMFLETDFTANGNDNDYDGGILIYEHNSEEYIWFDASSSSAQTSAINGSDQVCLDNTTTVCYEIYYYYIGSTVFPNGGFYVDIDGTNIMDIRHSQQNFAGLYGRMEFFGSYYGEGCRNIYGNLYGNLSSVSVGAGYIIDNRGNNPPGDDTGTGVNGSNGSEDDESDDDNSIAPESIIDTRDCNNNPYMVQLDMEFQSGEWSDQDNSITLRHVRQRGDGDYIWNYDIGSFQKNKQYRWSTCVDQRECNIFEFRDDEGNFDANSFVKLYVDDVKVLDVGDDDSRGFSQTPIQYTVDVGSC